MSGIFTLGQVGRQQDSGTWDTVSNVFLTEKLEPVLGNYGYIAGGNNKNHIWRIDFANDTNLCPARSSFNNVTEADLAEGLSSKDYGYWAGMYDQGSTIHRLDYSNDTVTPLERGRLAVDRNMLATSHNINYGYWMGGPATATAIQRTDFSNDTATALDRADLSVNGHDNAAGFGNMSYGYCAGGGDVISIIDRIDYANDTATAVAKGTLTANKSSMDASSNSAYGYVVGGGTPSEVSTVDRLDFSSDTTNCVAKGPLSVVRKGLGGTGHSGAGYHGGGTSGNSEVERIDYFNDTATAVVKGNLSDDGAWRCGGTGNRTKGLPELSTNYSAAVPYGYFAGGTEPNPAGTVSKIDRLDYDNDTATMVHKGSMPAAVEYTAAWSTLNYFYVTSGPAVLRLSYMNDTATTSSRGNITGTGLGRMFSVQNTNYAYIGGGPPSVTTIQRIDFANDGGGSSPKGPLTNGQYEAGGHSNQSYGYVVGGDDPSGPRSWVQRIDYSNDTSTAPVRANLPGTYKRGTGSSTLTYGYHSGGTYAGGPDNTHVFRIDFSTDTTAAVEKGPLTDGHGGNAGSTSNNTSYGYWAGGQSPIISTTDRIDYSSDTSTASPKGPLSAAREKIWEGASSSKEAVLSGLTSFQYDYTYAIPATVSETTLDSGKTQSYVTGGLTWDYSPLNELSISPGYGYFMGGQIAGPSQTSSIDRVDFGNDTATALVKGNLSHTTRRVGAFTSLNYGYRCGGLDAPASNATSDIERLDYTNDTGTLGDAGSLSLARNYAAGLSTKDYGYLGGGTDPSSDKTTVDRLDFSTDTTTAVAKGPLTVARAGLAGVMSADYGYWGGGLPAPSVKSTVDRIDFASDTTACVTKGPLSLARGYLSGTNSADFGYLGGGYVPSSPSPKSTVDKISFSNDTATAVVKGPLVAARYMTASTGNESYGYWTGGQTPVVSSVDRIDYSNDTVAATAKGPLESAKDSHAATSNRVLPSHRILKGLNNTFSEVQGPLTSYTTDYGYFIGGRNPSNTTKTTVDRVDYGNDTATALVKGSLSAARYHPPASVSSPSHGYVGGGTNPHPDNTSRIDRIDYSNDTSMPVDKGPLTVARYGLAASGTTSYGYFGGGFGPSYSTIVDRVDYSNDTQTTSPKGPLTSARYGVTATGNQSYGWFAGGGPAYLSIVDRVDYSNDTPTASPRGPMTAVRKYMAATGNANYGWYAGGFYQGPGGTCTVVERLDFSSDSTWSTRGPLTVDGNTGTSRFGAAGNANFGYFGGGGIPIIATVDRIDFSSDTGTAPAKCSLTVARYALTATGPKSYALPESYTSTVAYSNGTSFGGYNGGGLYRKSNIERMDYSNDGVDPINKANFPRGLESNNGAVSSLISGYWIGGETNPNPTPSSTINRLDYANDTNVVTVGNKTAAGKDNGAFGNKNYGYCASDITTMQRLDYANDLAVMLARSTGNPTISERGCTASADYGYYNNSGNVINRLDFANDTVAASSRTTLTYSIGGRSSAVGNVNYGWWFGSGPTTVGRVDYSNDTETATVRGYLQTLSPVSATYASGHGNENYGYVQGYYQPTIQRIDYANDMATPITRGQSKVYLGGAMSAGTSCRENSLSLHTIGQTTKDWQSAFAVPVQVVPGTQSAYWIGGNPSDNRLIQRLIIASDTIKATSRASTSANMSDTRSGVGNQYYGYLDMTSSTTNIERLDYANDTTNTTTHLFAAEARQQRGGTSTENYGYIAGGSPSNSFIDRIDFNSDTTTALARGPLAAATTHCRGVGNASYGYFGTGSITNVQRLDYSSDTDVAVKKADGLSGWGANATGNASYGYWGGGGPGSSRTDVRRLDYSSDTTTLAPKGPLSAGRSEHAAATGNISYGYWAGGEPATTNDTNISRIDYSNDTATALGRGPLATRIRDGNKLSGGHDALPQ